jgi:hypothetical protein
VNAGTPFACGGTSTTLAPGAAVTCSASHAVTQADLDAGSVTSSATASDGGATSAAVSATVIAAQTKALSLARMASPSTYNAVGQAITYGYTVTNGGNVTLGPAQFTIADSRIAGGAPFACGASTTLAPGAGLSCSATYTITEADLGAGSVTSSATASGAGVTAPTVAVTVTAVQPPPTTTSTTTFTGSVSSKRPKKTFTLTVGDGATVSALSFSVTGKSKTAATLTLRVLAPDGSAVAGTTGPSVVQVTTAPLARGTYTWEVSGSVSASFSLQVTYTAP